MEDKLTVRIKPYAGESLSSYLHRLTASNGLKMLHLWNSMKDNFTNHYAQWSDINVIDFAPTNTINIKRLSQFTGVAEERLFNCSFYNVLSLFCVNRDIEHSRLLSGMIRESLYYCPECFKEKKYMRLVWKISDINRCIKHDVNLLRTCVHCNKEIRYRDISVIGECPYCEKSLCGNIHTDLITQEELENELWQFDTWCYLVNNQKPQILSSEIAIRILYLLNNQEENLNIELIENTMQNSGVLPTLLQHARQTLAQERTLHISFILTILKENNIGIKEFLGLEVPSIFSEKVKLKRQSVKDRAFCFAPWCPSYNKSGSLIKTGTTLKTRANGKVLKYYLICISCGCEYAYNEENLLEERTYFIDVYNKLNEQVSKRVSLNNLVLRTGLTSDKVKRSFAYFRSRNVFPDIDYKEGITVKNNLLNNFIEAVTKGESNKAISNWNCWSSYDDYLTYRYHIKVIYTLNKKDKKTIDVKADKEKKIIDLLDIMYKSDEDISLRTVCEKLNVCPETIRNWGCNKVISDMKEKQKVKRTLEKKMNIYTKVDQFLLDNKNKRLSASEIYSHLEHQRTVLWRIAPELTAYIASRREEHNRQLNKGRGG